VNDPTTYWLTVTNIALGLVTLICIAAVGIGIIQELAAKRKRRAEMASLDREVANLVSSFGDRHAFHTPSLGVTMADGGEEFEDKDQG